MDIDVALANARRVTALVLSAVDNGRTPDLGDVVEMSEEWQAIDEWLSTARCPSDHFRKSAV